jgi:hypothetical protein
MKAPKNRSRQLSMTGSVLAAVTALSACGGDLKETPSAHDSSGHAGATSSGGSGATSQAGASSSVGGASGSSPSPAGNSSAADIARKLGRKANFLIGMGNDLPSDYNWEHSGIYTLSVPLDLHYIYLAYGWENWNAGGWFAQLIGAVDVKKGAVPMATAYTITGKGENNFDTLVDDSYMTPYWDATKLLMQRYGDAGEAAVVHVEPDFWAYAQQKSKGDPQSVPVHLHPDCQGLPQDLSGMARCWVKLARSYAPKVVVGLHASEWGGGSGTDVGNFLNAVGGGEPDIVVIDMLDRDAGCFEAAAMGDADAQKVCTRGGTFYLDATNQTSPNFREKLEFAKQVHEATGKPILWWQLPFGVPSDQPGGTTGHYRDNKVKYLFEHVQEFVDAGGLGATFGPGAGEQTTITTDGGQFDAAVKAYYANPVPLP